MKMKNNRKEVIEDLTGGTGAWSEFYRRAGYKVVNITLPEYDITDEKTIKYCISLNPYGILFAPPCTVWAGSGARWWADRTSDEIFKATRILIAGLRIIYNSKPKFWALENPVGKMRYLLGEPKLIFNPCDYGDPYTKKTLLWGNFNTPKKNSVKPLEGSKIHKYPPSENRAMLRSITPRGFAKAFYEANR